MYLRKRWIFISKSITNLGDRVYAVSTNAIRTSNIFVILNVVAYLQQHCGGRDLILWGAGREGVRTAV